MSPPPGGGRSPRLPIVRPLQHLVAELGLGWPVEEPRVPHVHVEPHAQPWGGGGDSGRGGGTSGASSTHRPPPPGRGATHRGRSPIITLGDAPWPPPGRVWREMKGRGGRGETWHGAGTHGGGGAMGRRSRRGGSTQHPPAAARTRRQHRGARDDPRGSIPGGSVTPPHPSAHPPPPPDLPRGADAGKNPLFCLFPPEPRRFPAQAALSVPRGAVRFRPPRPPPQTQGGCLSGSPHGKNPTPPPTPPPRPDATGEELDAPNPPVFPQTRWERRGCRHPRYRVPDPPGVSPPATPRSQGGPGGTWQQQQRGEQPPPGPRHRGPAAGPGSKVALSPHRSLRGGRRVFSFWVFFFFLSFLIFF